MLLIGAIVNLWRSNTIYEFRRKASLQLNAVAAIAIYKGEPYDHLYKYDEMNQTQDDMFWNLTKWTFKQHYPELWKLTHDATRTKSK